MVHYCLAQHVKEGDGTGSQQLHHPVSVLPRAYFIIKFLLVCVIFASAKRHTEIYIIFLDYVTGNLCFYSPPDDEVRQSNDKGANRHQDTTHCNDLWPMELGPEVTNKSYHQQVTCNDRGTVRDMRSLESNCTCCQAEERTGAAADI